MAYIQTPHQTGDPDGSVRSRFRKRGVSGRPCHGETRVAGAVMKSETSDDEIPPSIITRYTVYYILWTKSNPRIERVSSRNSHTHLTIAGLKTVCLVYEQMTDGC